MRFTCRALSESHSFYCGIMTGACHWRRSRRQAEAVHTFSDCIRGMDCRHNPHAAAAMCAFENIDRKNSFHQFGPWVIPGLTYPRPLRTFALRMGFVFPGRAASVGDGLGCFGVCGDHPRPPARARSKNAAIPHQVEPGRGHERGEFFNQFKGRQNDVGGSVAPPAFLPLQQAAVGQS
jgi:hypothetical protein